MIARAGEALEFWGLRRHSHEWRAPASHSWRIARFGECCGGLRHNPCHKKAYTAFEALAVYLIDHPDAGDVIPASGGVRKLRWAAKRKGKRGGARVIYLYIVVAARIYLVRCYAKNVKRI